jgi:hypothetical protein
MVGFAFFISFISFFFSVLQVQRKKRSKVNVDPSMLQLEWDMRTLRVASEKPKVRIRAAITHRLPSEQAEHIYSSLVGHPRVPEMQSFDWGATAERKSESGDDPESDATAPSPIEELLSPPGQAGRNPNVGLKKSTGVPNDMLCGSNT